RGARGTFGKHGSTPLRPKFGRLIMGLWRRRAKAREDAIFGRIVRDRHGWTVEASGSDKNHPVISLIGGDDGPTDAQRLAHQQLPRQLNEFAEDLTSALYELYAPYLDLSDWEGPRPDSAKALREMVELSSITYLEDGVPELLFAFKGDLWPDATFVVEIRGGKVRGVALDD